jgi:hypothetical protein|nr:MAG TPA: hypothetical protein [Caudoviricetes sp.]
MSKSKDNRKYLFTREQYKKIKKMAHTQMDEWIRTFVKNLDDDNMKNNVEIFVSFDEKNKRAIMTALENTKGIGEKIRGNFLENYDKAMKDIIENIEKGEDK